MDPVGFALEQFDAVGTWRTTDGPNTIDASSVMYDGTKINGPADLRNFVLGYKDQFTRTVTEKLLTYALGGASSTTTCRSCARSCATLIRTAIASTR
jgi:hypothetical protein